jgi:hypothetical protein
MKWDGDMILTREGTAALADLAWQIESQDTVVSFQHFPLYIESERVGYFDAGLPNSEPWIYPEGPGSVFVKGFDWETRTQPADVRRLMLPQGLCFELKWLDSDEFAHWSTPDAFDPVRSPRKVREHHVFDALAAGRFADLESVHRIEAPPDVHIVDHVAEVWLPSRSRPLAG